MEQSVRPKNAQGSTREPPHSEGANSSMKNAKFMQKVQESSEAIESGDFTKAIRLYTEALSLDPQNHVLFSNRSAAYIKMKEYQKALQDARKAKEINPQWSKGYYREGVALQCLGKKVDALASYASGLAQDAKNPQLLQSFIEACLEPPLKERFGPLYTQLQKMKLDQSPFVVISVVGQDLLAQGFYAASTTVLESALRIGTCSLKLRGSVFSALSSAHWGMANIDKAIACMQQDLAIAKSLGDQEGECRAHGNLGSAYFSKGTYQEALTHHRCQLVLAMRLKDRKTAAAALSSLGHVYTALGDYANALASHKQCVLLVKQSKDKLQEAREIGNVGAVYLATGDLDSALECHNEHLKIAKQLNNKVEEARAYSNIGSAHHYKRDFEKAVTFHQHVLNIASELEDRTLEARAYAGLGHAARCMQDMKKAKEFHEKQLDSALQTKDKVAEGRACSNLGIIYHNMGEYDAALKLHKVNLQIAKSLSDRASQGRAYGNIGNCHSSLKQFDLAIRFHKQELAISKEVNDKHSESSTHGNLAVAYHSLNMSDKALHHYNIHLKMSQQLKDQPSEARALSNLGNHYSSQKGFKEAISFYEQFLTLSQELGDVEGEGKACHKLGFAHYCLGNYKEAIRYYEQDLALARDVKDDMSMCRAFCNLGLARKALGEYDEALECQQNFLARAKLVKNGPSTFSALGNIGDVYSMINQNEEAAKYFQQQLQLAKQIKDQKMEAIALGNLGSIYRLLQQYDKSIGYHNQELQLYLNLKDIKGECRGHGNLGNVHMTLGSYSNAYRCYEEQLDRSRELQDSALEAHAYGNLGITKINMGHFDDAIGLFEQQLAMLEQVQGQQAFQDKCRALGNLGDCYDSLGDYQESVICYEQQLAIAQKLSVVQEQDKAYRGLGNAHRAMGNLQQALVCFEKRLVIAHELDKQSAKSSAYGELGCLHSLLGNFEQAISCLQHQLRISREIGDMVGDGEASCGLGGVYQQMGEYEKALEYHEKDLNIAQEAVSLPCQCRAFGNLGLSQESLGNYEEAIHYQEQHLNVANQLGDKVAKTLALSSLGRVHHAMGNYPRAIQYLRQGLVIAEQLSRREDEAKIRHRLGLALWAHGSLEEAMQQLYGATELFESIRREAQFNNDYKLSLFDLQTASYQSLQRVLVTLGNYEEALLVAERGRTRAFVDLLVERQNVEQDSWYSSIDSTPVTTDQILEIVNKQRSAVLYYSIAAGYLYSWLILPEKGIVKFHETTVSEIESGSDPEDTQSVKSYRSLAGSTSLLDVYVGQARESLGVESHLSNSRLSLSKSSCAMSETESEADDLWQQHLEELGDRLNSEGDRTGFLRMVNRNHAWNASSYSLGSMMSFSGSVNGLLTPRSGSTRSRISHFSTSSNGKPPLSTLYELLIQPMEEFLPAITTKHRPDLVMVLQGDLYLIPFAVLKSSQAAPCMFERFNLLSVPSVRALQASHVISRHNEYNPNCSGAVVIGNPRLPMSIVNMWQWNAIPASEQECRMVGEMVGTRALTGADATKTNIQQRIQKAEVLHFATHVSWKLAALVLSASDYSTTRPVQGNLERMDLSDSNSDINASSFDGPPLCDFLLTAADVLNTNIHAKLVVLSSGHTDERAGRINADGVIGLTRAFLAAGAQCVLLSLWPLPELAAKIFLKSFYTSMLQGSKSSYALSEAMKSVQNSRQFSHPSNWAGWMLVGNDVKLSSKVALMGHALCELLQTPAKSREAMRVVLHLVEKSLQRIHQGMRSAMYTTQASIENKVGDVTGWKDLLNSVGFRLEPSAGNIPAAVFFPTSDPGERLTQLSASLQALLGLSIPTLTALSKMIMHQDVGEAVTALMKEMQTKFGQEEGNQVKVPVRLWRAQGCHEFLASIGFDLVEVGKDEVTIKAGKSANRRTLQFSLQAMVAVFDTQQAPRSLILDSSSSMESLCSSGSATSTSNFSKGSTPPTSPNNYRKKSFFNPAEVEKMPTVYKVPQGSSSSHKSRHIGSDPANQLALQNAIRQKYSSPSASDLSDSNTGEGPSPKGAETEGEKIPVSNTSSAKSRVRGGLFERSSTRGFFPATPPNMYSTSASDSEDAVVPDNNLSRQQSRSSLSLASQSSTLTQRSTGSSSAFRRTRARSSAASTRSSASDRTITNDSRSNSRENLVSSHENLLEFYSAENIMKEKHDNDNLSDSGIHSKHTDTNTDNSADNGETSHSKGDHVKVIDEDPKPAEKPEKEWFETGEESCESSTEASKPSMNPTEIAQKVMAETQSHRYKLEAMQQWSVHNLQQRRIAQGPGKVEDSVDSPTSKPSVASKPVTVTPGGGHSESGSSNGVRTAKSITDELENLKISAKVDNLHYALSPKERPPTKPKPIMANSVYDSSVTMHKMDKSNSSDDSNKPLSLAIIEQKMNDSLSEEDVDFPNLPLESITEEDEGNKSISEVNESSNLSSTDTEHEVQEATGNQSSSSQDTVGVLKGAMKKSSKPSNKNKSVKFEDEVILQDINKHSKIESGNKSLPANSYDVKFAETTFIENLGVSAAPSSALVPPQPVVKEASPTDVTPFTVPSTMPQSSLVKPASPQPPLGYKLPPPYPGNRRQGSQDSSSSKESALSSSSWSSSGIPNYCAPIKPQDQLQNRPLQKSSHPQAEEKEDDFNSPMNLQKASRQFYQAAPNSSGIAKLDGSFRKKVQEKYSPVASHKVIGSPSQEADRKWIAPSGIPNTVEVVQGPGLTGPPPAYKRVSPSQEISREWYHSDTDSVCSHSESQASSLRGSGQEFFSSNQLNHSNRNLRNEWIESQNKIVAQQQKRNLPISGGNFSTNQMSHGYQNLPPSRHSGPTSGYPRYPGQNRTPVNGGYRPPVRANGYPGPNTQYPPNASVNGFLHGPPPSYQPGSPRAGFMPGSPRSGHHPLKPVLSTSRAGTMPPPSLLQSIDPGEKTEEVRYRDTILQASKC